MILVDSGPLIAAAIKDDRDRRRCVDLFASLHLNTERWLELTAEPVLSFLIYTAEPGSPSEERLGLLASWATTPAKRG